MIRVLIFFAIVLALAFGAVWMTDHPGTVQIAFAGQDYQMSTLTGLVVVLVAAVLLIIAWTLIRFLLSIPSLMGTAMASRKRQRGYHALSRGMVAVGSGDAQAARRHAADASRLLRHEPMALLLQAQAAQLSGEREEAEAVFKAMLKHPDTRVLALRGLHMEAVRRGDPTAALAHAEEAQKIGTLPWAAQAVLRSRAQAGDWAGALKAVDRNAGARVIDRLTANRQRAVLLTAMAREQTETAPEDALTDLREALKFAPTLVPAAVMAGQMLARKGDAKKASRVIETAYAETPHPALAEAYLHARYGDAASDRLARAETLARCAPDAAESRLLVARAALEARDLVRARGEMATLLDDARPTRRACLLMAEIEEAEHGETGALFEWLQRASRAPRDPAWVADGVVSDRWEPVSPVTGAIDAYTWMVPSEQLTADYEIPVLHGTAATRTTPSLPTPVADPEAPPVIHPETLLDETPPRAETPAPV